MAFPIYPTTKEYNNLPSGHPICTVVSYKADGSFIPVAFGIEINQERYRYRVKAIHSINNNHNLYTFECVYEADGIRHTALLRFDTTSCHWYAE